MADGAYVLYLFNSLHCCTFFFIFKNFCFQKEKSERELEEVQVGLESKSSEAPPTPGPRTDSVNAVWNLVRKNRVKVCCFKICLFIN